eukprot:scaffold1943_cov343-Pavlova_lutheri.AAC.14
MAASPVDDAFSPPRSVPSRAMLLTGIEGVSNPSIDGRSDGVSQRKTRHPPFQDAVPEWIWQWTIAWVVPCLSWNEWH